MSKIASHDAYIAAAPEDLRPLLARLREQLAGALPDAEEVIAYNMPGFRIGKTIVAGYASFSQQCGLYLAPTAIAAHAASIEHLRDFGVLTGDGTDWHELAQRELDEGHVRAVAAKLKAAGVWVCPTSILYESHRWSPDTIAARWPSGCSSIRSWCRIAMRWRSNGS